MGEEVVNDAALDELANDLREHNLDIGRAVDTIVRSELFFSEGNMGNRVLSPVEFIVNAVRSLELLSPPPSTLLLAEWTATLGQNLFYPPNVFGWPGGRAWLTTRSLIGRSNFVTSLIEGSIFNPQRSLAADRLAAKHGYEGQSVPEFFSQLLVGLEPSSPQMTQQLVRLQTHPGASALDAVFAILTAPNAMLG